MLGQNSQYMTKSLLLIEFRSCNKTYILAWMIYCMLVGRLKNINCIYVH